MDKGRDTCHLVTLLVQFTRLVGRKFRDGAIAQGSRPLKKTNGVFSFDTI